MMQTVPPLLLVTVSGAAVLATAACLYAAGHPGRAQNRRISGIVSAYSQALMPTIMTAAAPGARRRGRPEPLTALLDFLRIDLSQPDLYPAQWWLIVAVVLTVAVIFTGGVVFFAGPPGWVALPVVSTLFVRTVFGGYRTRRSTLLHAQLPDALAMIVRSVRAGIPVPEALRIVGEEGQKPTSTEFARLSEEIRLGGSLQEVLVKLAKRSSLMEYRFFAVAVALQSRSGGNLTDTLENLADVVRKRAALKERAIALSSEARLTIWILSSLPFIVAMALIVLSPDYLLLLVTTRAGKMILLTGFVFLGIGIGSMKFIIKKAVS
jgi:tight adherence protein B